MNTKLVSWQALKKDPHEALPQVLSVFYLLLLVFIAGMLEKLSSHRYVVEEGSNVDAHLFKNYTLNVCRHVINMSGKCYLREGL